MVTFYTFFLVLFTWVTGLSRPARVAYSIYKLIRDVGQARAPDISSSLCIPLKNVYSALKTLEKRGVIERKFADGGYYFVVKKDFWVG